MKRMKNARSYDKTADLETWKLEMANGIPRHESIVNDNVEKWNWLNTEQFWYCKRIFLYINLLLLSKSNMENAIKYNEVGWDHEYQNWWYRIENKSDDGISFIAFIWQKVYVFTHIQKIYMRYHVYDTHFYLHVYSYFFFDIYFFCSRIGPHCIIPKLPLKNLHHVKLHIFVVFFFLFLAHFNFVRAINILSAFRKYFHKDPFWNKIANEQLFSDKQVIFE